MNLFDHVKDPFIKEQCKTIFQTQKECVKVAEDQMLTIPIIRRAYFGTGQKDSLFESYNPIFDLISVQSTSSFEAEIHYKKLGLNENLKFREKIGFKKIPIYDKHLMLSENILLEENRLSFENEHRWCLAEPDAIEHLSICLRNTIIREVLTDLRKHAATTSETNELHSNNILELYSTIREKTHEEGKFWIAGSKDIVKEFIDDNLFDSHQTYISPQLFKGKFDSLILVDDLFPSNQLLIGMKNGDIGSGYFHAPYKCQILPPIKEISSVSVGGLVIRHAKWLSPTGAKYYAKLQLES